jgi:hypothetical protein
VSRSSLRRSTLLVLFILLIAPWSAAAAGHNHSPKRPQGFEAAPLSVLLGSFFGLLTKAGCVIDPDGLLTSPTDAGCVIDPSGRCATAASEARSEIDPNG